MNAEKPIAKFRAGAVTCALWENQVQVNGSLQPMLKATLTRRYQDRAGVWKNSESLSRNEIPLAIYVLQKAFEYMVERPDDPRAQGVEEEVVI